MKSLYRGQSWTLGLIILGLSLIPVVPSSAGQFEEEMSSQEALFINGTIHTVSSKDQRLTIRQHKGPHISITIYPESEFGGFSRFEELQAGQAVKIWYRPEAGGNIGLKILKLPELGC